MGIKTYRGKDIDVTFEAERCIHSAECGRRLREVFDVGKRPWAQPDNATADQVQATIDHCPSGALKYVRHDGGGQEEPPAKNVVVVMDSGEYRLRGNIRLVTDGELAAEECRMTLCRCGASENKPFCDNSHRKIGFDATSVAVGEEISAEIQPSNTLKVTPLQDGPLLLQEPIEIQDAAGNVIFQGTKAALCRCGESANKPFCDGAHGRIGFSVGG